MYDATDHADRYHLDHDATIDALEVELTRMVAVAGRCPTDLPIPTCPEWSAADLWEHLGTVHRWVTEIVGSRATERFSRRDMDVGAPTDGRWAPWLADGGDRLLAALRDTAAADPVWSWGDDDHARWWARRQLHETVIHDADACLAMNEEFAVPAGVAADGVCELLDNIPVRLDWPGAVKPSTDITMHLHATDAAADDPLHPEGLGDAGEWMVTFGDGTVSYTHGHGKGDVAVRAPVTDLMLLANRRIPADSERLEVFGDASTLATALDSLALR